MHEPITIDHFSHKPQGLIKQLPETQLHHQSWTVNGDLRCNKAIYRLLPLSLLTTKHFQIDFEPVLRISKKQQGKFRDLHLPASRSSAQQERFVVSNRDRRTRVTLPGILNIAISDSDELHQKRSYGYEQRLWLPLLGCDFHLDISSIPQNTSGLIKIYFFHFMHKIIYIYLPPYQLIMSCNTENGSNISHKVSKFVSKKKPSLQNHYLFFFLLTNCEVNPQQCLGNPIL